jgi:hypothetical protein
MMVNMRKYFINIYPFYSRVVAATQSHASCTITVSPHGEVRNSSKRPHRLPAEIAAL